MPDAALILAATKDRNLAIIIGVLFVINLMFAGRSQIDAWAEAHPRIAGTMKAMRGLGLDPWMLLQSASLIVKGRLPAAQTKPVVKVSETVHETVHVIIPPKDG